jgi:hypothetical protein
MTTTDRSDWVRGLIVERPVLSSPFAASLGLSRDQGPPVRRRRPGVQCPNVGRLFSLRPRCGNAQR